MVLRSNFQDEIDFEDTLGLAELVNQRLRDVSTRGSQAPLVFVDAAQLPNAYRLAGRYQVDGEDVTVAVQLSKGKERIRFTVEGQLTEIAQIAGEIGEETQKHFKQLID